MKLMLLKPKSIYLFFILSLVFANQSFTEAKVVDQALASIAGKLVWSSQLQQFQERHWAADLDSMIHLLLAVQYQAKSGATVEDESAKIRAAQAFLDKLNGQGQLQAWISDQKKRQQVLYLHP